MWRGYESDSLRIIELRSHCVEVSTLYDAKYRQNQLIESASSHRTDRMFISYEDGQVQVMGMGFGASMVEEIASEAFAYPKNPAAHVRRIMNLLNVPSALADWPFGSREGRPRLKCWDIASVVLRNVYPCFLDNLGVHCKQMPFGSKKENCKVFNARLPQDLTKSLTFLL